MDPDLEPVGSGIMEQELIGFGIIVPARDPDPTFLIRKSVKALQIFLQNGPIRYAFDSIHNSLNNMYCTLKICQLVS